MHQERNSVFNIDDLKRKIETAKTEKNRAEAQLKVRQEELHKLLVRLKDEFGIEDPSKIDESITEMKSELDKLEKEINSLIDGINTILDARKYQF